MLHLVLPLELTAALVTASLGTSGAPPEDLDPLPGALQSSPELRVLPNRVLAPIAPRQDSFQGGELAAAGAGALAGDALVFAEVYGTLQLFASRAVPVTASNMRSAAYALGISALLVPPLLSSSFAAWAWRGPHDGAFWKAFLLATAGQAAALAAGWLLAPAYWAILPIQLVAVPLGSAAGLSWGSPRGLTRSAPPDAGPSQAAPAPLAQAICPDS